MAITRAVASSITQGLPKQKTLLAGNSTILPGSYESIATVTVSSSVSSVSFTSIPSTYTHLQIRLIGNNSATDAAYTTFNSDTGTNYTRHRLVGNGTAATAASGLTQTAIVTNSGTIGFPSTANCFGPSIMDILDYANTNKYKTVRTLSGVDINSSGGVELASGLWMNTAAITRIDIAAYLGNWTQYSTFALYGIR